MERGTLFKREREKPSFTRTKHHVANNEGGKNKKGFFVVRGVKNLQQRASSLSHACQLLSLSPRPELLTRENSFIAAFFGSNGIASFSPVSFSFLLFERAEIGRRPIFALK